MFERNWEPVCSCHTSMVVSQQTDSRFATEQVECLSLPHCKKNLKDVDLFGKTALHIGCLQFHRQACRHDMQPVTQWTTERTHRSNLKTKSTGSGIFENSVWQGYIPRICSTHRRFRTQHDVSLQGNVALCKEILHCARTFLHGVVCVCSASC